MIFNSHGIMLLVISCVTSSETDSQYIGCYKDDKYNHAMTVIAPNHSTSRSIADCLEFCRLARYTFTGLKSGRECHCGDDFAKHGEVNRTACDQPCSGNSTDICGGNGTLSIYTTCSQGFYGTACSIPCPNSCIAQPRGLCHLLTGNCCNSTDMVPYCNFYDIKGCHNFHGNLPLLNRSLYVNSSGLTSFYPAIFFPDNVEVTEITYFPNKDEKMQYISLWRQQPSGEYIVLTKLDLYDWRSGVLTMQIHVQSNDIITFHPLNHKKNKGLELRDTHYVFISGPDDFNISDRWQPQEDGYIYLLHNGSLSCSVQYNCIQVCPPGTYGFHCSNICGRCKDNDVCHHLNGYCERGCAPGYKGLDCTRTCRSGPYGEMCSQECPSNCDSSGCDHITSNCFYCKNGFTGVHCEDECPPGTYGSGCDGICNCRNNSVCHFEDGHCDSGCAPGYQGYNCSTACYSGFFGLECIHPCGRCKNNDSCTHVDGYCEKGCARGYEGLGCHQPCKIGHYGDGCLEGCSNKCENADCHHETGICFRCKKGFTGVHCEECPYNTFGYSCQECSVNCDMTPCDRESGHCLNGKCLPGFQGKNCTEACAAGKYGVGCHFECGGHCLGPCNHVDGVCTEGCDGDWTGHYCDIEKSTKGPALPILSATCGVLVLALLLSATILVLRKHKRKPQESNQENIHVHTNLEVHDLSKTDMSQIETTDQRTHNTKREPVYEMTTEMEAEEKAPYKTLF